MVSPRTLFASLRKLVRSKKLKARTKCQCSDANLAVESLEDRRLLAVSAAQFYLNGTRLVVTGSPEADSVTVSQTAEGMINARLESGGESVSAQYSPAQISQIIFYGREGDDSFANNTTIASKVLGESGNDSLVGGAGVDELNGGEGNDTLTHGAGNDVLYGGIGEDSVSGDEGDDIVYGGDGDDRILGGEVRRYLARRQRQR